MKKDILYDDYAKQLEGEYRTTYDQISIYIESIISPGSNYGAIMSEVVDLLISAQSDQRTVESIMGSDIKLFCEELVSSHTGNISERIINFLSFYRIIALIAFAVEAFSLFFDYTDGVKELWTASISMGGFFTVLFLSLIVFSIFKKISGYAVFKFNWYTKKIDNIMTILLLIILMILNFFLPTSIHSLIPIPRWIFLPAMILIFVFTTIHKKKEKQKDMSENNYYSFDEVAYNSNIEQLRKKYTKYCLRCTKKNIEPDDVKTWYEIRYKKDMRGERLGQIGFIFIVGLAIFGNIINNEPFEAFIFIVILLCIEIPLYKTLDKGRIARIKIYKHIHEKETDIFDDSLLIEDVLI